VRGDKPGQGWMFSYVSPEQRVPADHPLRRVKKLADSALLKLSSEFDGMYSRLGRPSIPPESLLKAQLLMALYSVRSDRLFCESLEYNILFRWFLDIDMDAPSFDASSFSKNRQRLIDHAIGQRFLAEIVEIARQAELLSDEHFTVDGTLIEAWASLKSFTNVETKQTRSSDDDPSNPTVNFHGEQRRNSTHRSTTDADARLARKGSGKEAKLSYSGHILMENRHGLCVDIQIEQATGTAERDVALQMLERYRRANPRIKTVGADKGYHSKDFVSKLRGMDIVPHIAAITGRRTPGLDGRTTQSTGYGISQRIRKQIEEIFGWGKQYGGLRKTRFRGTPRVREHGFLVAAAYDLLRMAKMMPEPYFQT
jgi:transposase